MPLPPIPHPGRPSGGARACAREGFTVIEVIVAMMLILVVAGGVGMAVVGSSKVQGSAKGKTSLNETAQRVFESLRGDRDWMDSCRTRSSCDLSGQVPAGLLEDRSLGKRCGTGSTTYRHELTTATAWPIDSDVDGTAADDADGIVPDYYRIRIVVDVPTCDQVRLGRPLSGIFESAIDEKGRVLKGSVIVEVCRVINQIDDRMSIGGCADPSRLHMMRCPQLYANNDWNPANKCSRAYSVANAYTPHDTRISTYVAMRHYSTTFELRGPSGSYSSSSARLLSPGVYLFRDLPAGTYQVQDIAFPNRWELWDAKTIPAPNADNTEGRITVQPDVQSKALIVMRPKRLGAISMVFYRRVRYYHAYKRIVPKTLVTDNAPTETFEGNPSSIRETFSIWMRFLRVEGIRIDYDGNYTIDGNCIRANYTWIEQDFTTGEWISTPKTVEACSYYKLWVKFEYIRTGYLYYRDREGAAMDAAYALTPAPTFRDLVPPDHPSYRSGCLMQPMSGVTTRLQYVAASCIDEREPSPRNRLTINGISAGLNTGVSDFGKSWGWSPTANTWGDTWTSDRNTNIRDIPDDLRDGPIWVRTDGSITTPGRNYGINPRFSVLGYGECYWREDWTGGGFWEGSCNVCKPYLRSMSGTYPSCYILTRGWYWKCVYFTGENGYMFEGDQPECIEDRNANTGVQLCSGAPDPGNTYTITAANCNSISTGCGSSCGSTSRGSGIPRNSHRVAIGYVVSRATPVGSS